MKQTAEEKRVLEEMELLPVKGEPYDERLPEACDTMEELCRYWLKERRGGIKRSTYCDYDYFIRRHILPYFQNDRLRELNGDNVLAFVEEMRRRGVADTTVKSVVTVLRSIFKFAVQNQILGREILPYCALNFRRAESRVLTVQDSAGMKEYLLTENTAFSIAILLCRGTGMRIGELCGLKWGDIDLLSKTVCIRRTISRIPNPDTSQGQPKTVLYVRTPKSHTSIREIPIPQYLIAPLKKMKLDNNKYLLTGRETFTEPRNVQKKFKTILKHCEIEDCNFHAMRHGFATACLEKGVDCKTVSSILGHASTRTTMEIYVHTSIRQMQNCIDSVN